MAPFCFNSAYNREGRWTGKQRPLQSQRSTAGVAVGLVNSTNLLFIYCIPLCITSKTQAHFQTSKLDQSGSDIKIRLAILGFVFSFIGVSFFSLLCFTFYRLHTLVKLTLYFPENPSLHSVLTIRKQIAIVNCSCFSKSEQANVSSLHTSSVQINKRIMCSTSGYFIFGKKSLWWS